MTSHTDRFSIGLTCYVNVTPWETWHYTLLHTHNNDKERTVVHRTFFLGKRSYMIPVLTSRWCCHHYFSFFKNPPSNCSCKHPQPHRRPMLEWNTVTLQGWKGWTCWMCVIDRLNYFLHLGLVKTRFLFISGTGAETLQMWDTKDWNNSQTIWQQFGDL